MRIPPNDHPMIRVRNSLLFAAAMLGLWALLMAARPATHLPTPSAGITTRPTTAGALTVLIGPAQPIPLAQPLIRRTGVRLRT